MPAASAFPGISSGPTTPAVGLVAITPNDSADLATQVRMIYVGTGGDVSVIDTLGTTVVHKNVLGGTYLGPFWVARVKATGTTAADMVGYL